MLSLLSVTVSRKNCRYNDTHGVSGEKKENHAQYDHHDTNWFTVNPRKRLIPNLYCHTKETGTHQYCMTNLPVSRAGNWQPKQDQNFRVVGAKKDGGYRGAECSNEKNPV